MSEQVTIICPGCNQPQRATIDTYAIPGTDYVIDGYAHECTCGYLITESEWEEVEEKDPRAVDPDEFVDLERHMPRFYSDY